MLDERLSGDRVGLTHAQGHVEVALGLSELGAGVAWAPIYRRWTNALLARLCAGRDDDQDGDDGSSHGISRAQRSGRPELTRASSTAPPVSTLSPEKDFGALYGEENRCPHCGALSRLEKHPELRWVCAVCGGPRVPAKVVLGPDGTQALRDALAAQRSAVGSRVGSWALGLFAAFALAFGVAVAWFGIMLILGGLMAVASGLLTLKGRAARKSARGHVALAWEQAIGSMLERSGNDATAKSIAASLGVPEAEVETALATLSATGKTRVDVGDDAELHYRASEAPLPEPEDDAEGEKRTAKR